jgi:hypothetical protein
VRAPGHQSGHQRVRRSRPAAPRGSEEGPASGPGLRPCDIVPGPGTTPSRCALWSRLGAGPRASGSGFGVAPTPSRGALWSRLGTGSRASGSGFGVAPTPSRGALWSRLGTGPWLGAGPWFGTGPWLGTEPGPEDAPSASGFPAVPKLAVRGQRAHPPRKRKKTARAAVASENRSARNRIGETLPMAVFTSVKVAPQITVLPTSARSARRRLTSRSRRSRPRPNSASAAAG